MSAPDLIIFNGRLFRGSLPGNAYLPGSAAGPAVADAPTAVAVAGDRIAAVGSDAAVTATGGDRTALIDAQGGLLSAGFDDAHIHFRMGSLALLGVDLFGIHDLSEIQAAIRRYASAHPDLPWVIGRGWMYAAFPGGMPTREQLDAIVADRPTFIDCYDGHTGWANTKALRAAGITRDTPDPVGGEIVRDPATGEPTGALKESATHLVEELQPTPDEDRTLDAIRTALTLAAKAGLTSVQDAWSDPSEFDLFGRLAASDELTLRLRLAMPLEPGLDSQAWAARLDEYEAAVAPWANHPWLRGGILKAFADGVVEARTASLLEPYATEATRGAPNFAPGELRERVALAHKSGWQVETHAIGDAAVRDALDAYEALGPDEARHRHHRIEHMETVDPADMGRFGALGVVASFQPYHADPDPADIALFERELGPERAGRGWPWRSIHAAGGVLAFGSDWPVVPFDPFLALHGAVTRTTADGTPQGGAVPNERLGIADALSAYTVGSALAGRGETERGVLRPGKLADLIVLDRDILAEGASAILGSRVTLTVVGGRVVHREI